MLILESPWTRQPQTVVGLSLSHPAASGLVGSWTPIDPGMSLGGQAKIVGNIQHGVGAQGRAWQGAFQQSYNYVRIDRTAQFAYTNQVAFEALIRVDAYQTTSFPYITGVISQFQSTSDTLTAYYGPTLRFNATAVLGNAAKPCFLITQSTTERSAASTVALPVGVHHLIGSYDGVTLALYVNGVLTASASVTGAFDNHASNWISLLSDYSGWTTDTHKRCLNGQMYLARIYNKGKTAAEAAFLSRNAWALFAPRRIYIPTPAAAVPTLSASTYVPGSMTSTGWRPQITAS